MRSCSRRTFLFLFLSVNIYFLPEVQAQSCPPNIDFETGTFDGWTCYTGFTSADGGQNVMTLKPVPPEEGRHTMYAASSQVELDSYGNFPVNCPNGSGYSIRLGNNSGGHEAEGVSYEFTIPAGQDSYSLIYYYAVVFQQPRHLQHEQPRMEIEVTNITDNYVINCASFTFIAYGSSLPGFELARPQADTIPVWYKNWTAVSVDLSGNAGKKIRLFFKTADCTFNRHFGYAYIDVNSDCDGKITGADYCVNDTAVNVIAPYGYESYRWYNQSLTQQLGNQQILTLMPPPPPNTLLALKLTPYDGYGCDQTVMVELNNTLTIKANAGRDTISCNNKAIQLGGLPKPGLVYSWAPATGLSNVNISNPYAVPASTMSYVLTVQSSGGGCLSRDTVVVKASKLDASMQLLGKDMYCIGSPDSAVLKVNPIDSITWFKNNLPVPHINQPVLKIASSGTYFALLANKDGCVLPTVPKTISIASVPSAEFSLTNPAQCLTGNRFDFTNISTNSVGNMSYRWLPGDGRIFNSQHLNYSYSEAGKYRVTLIVSSNPVCADTVSSQIEVYQNAVADFGVTPKCVGIAVPIINNTLDTMASPVNYKWVFGNGQTSNTRDPQFPVYSSTGNYEISLSVNTNQCPDPLHTLKRVVKIDAPLPGINYRVKYALIGTPLRLQARSIGESALWAPATYLNNPRLFDPIFNGSSDQLYTIQITTGSGCATVDTQLVKSVKEVMIFVPNAFTPNNDGKNDLLRPTLMGVKQLKYFRVFNRWGQLMYQTTTEEAGWNGLINGMPQASQTFVWMLEAIGVDDKPYVLRGTSVLLK